MHTGCSILSNEFNIADELVRQNLQGMLFLSQAQLTPFYLSAGCSDDPPGFVDVSSRSRGNIKTQISR